MLHRRQPSERRRRAGTKNKLWTLNELATSAGTVCKYGAQSTRVLARSPYSRRVTSPYSRRVTSPYSRRVAKTCFAGSRIHMFTMANSKCGTMGSACAHSLRQQRVRLF